MQLMIWLRMSVIRLVVLGICKSPSSTYGKFWRQCCRDDMGLGVITKRVKCRGDEFVG